jgi:hypothetical protein
MVVEREFLYEVYKKLSEGAIECIRYYTNCCIYLDHYSKVETIECFVCEIEAIWDLR